MKKQIALQNRKITYTLRKSQRARRMRLAVYLGGSVVVTTPHDLSQMEVEKFIRAKTRWLFSKIDFFKQFTGREIGRRNHRQYLKYKDEAYRLAAERVEHFNAFYGFTFNQINIKNQKTRWGSCSKKGNLNFNYKIALLPPELADYVIVHELCHLREFNHSKKFWALVAKALPDYASIQENLRKAGILLQ